MAQNPELLTSGQVADRLGVSRQTVHRWAKEGRIPSSSLPSRVLRFRREDIEAYAFATTSNGDAA